MGSTLSDQLCMASPKPVTFQAGSDASQVVQHLTVHDGEKYMQSVQLVSELLTVQYLTDTQGSMQKFFLLWATSSVLRLALFLQYGGLHSSLPDNTPRRQTHLASKWQRSKVNRRPILSLESL